MKTSKQTKSKDMFTEAARLAVGKVGWSPDDDLEILNPDGSGGSTSVRYGFRADKVHLQQSPELFNQVTNALGQIGKAGLGTPYDAFNDVVASRVYLLVGGFKVCPHSAYDYYEILDACADGLRSAGANETEIGQFTLAVTSSFIASVVAGVYSIEGPDPRSFRVGWSLDHIVSSIARGTTLQRYTALYANVQLHLWSDNQKLAAVLKSRFPQPFDALQFETDRGMSILLDTFEFVGLEQDGIAWSDDDNLSELIITELKYNWRSWPIKAFQWAEMIGPYIITDQGGRQLPQQPQLTPENRGSRPSEGARGRRNIMRTGSAPAVRDLLWLDGQGNSQISDVPMDPYANRLLNDPSFRKRLMQIGIGRGRTPRIMNYDALDALYRSRVTNVEIESEITRKKGMAFDIANMTREELGTTLPGFNNIDWGATRVDSDGELQLYAKKIPITAETPAKLDMAGFPDLLFIVDSSGSMNWDPKGGTGPYDSLLRAIYSVLHFLEQHNKAQYMRFAVVNFSGTTKKTPWLPFAELRKCKELLFRHEGGGTTLDCTTIKGIVDKSSSRFLCLMVTDAQISNATNVFNTIKMMVDHGHGFVLIQIGRPSPLTQQVQKAGLAVHVINDHTQLEGLCLEYARKTW